MELRANKGYKFRLYPTPEQKLYLVKCFGCSCFVYNHFLRLTTDAYAESKKQLRYGDTAKLLTLLKKDEQYLWLTEVNSQSLQQTIKDLESAFVRFFKKLGDFPVFKKKRNRQSFRFLSTGVSPTMGCSSFLRCSLSRWCNIGN